MNAASSDVDRQQDTSELAPLTEGETETWDERWCGHLKADGSLCHAYRVKGKDACAGHLGLGIGKDPAAYAAKASQRAAEVRVDKAEGRKRRLRDALADAVEGELHAPILAAYRRGLESEDPVVALRAAEGLLSRVYGKPKETIETHEAPAELKAVREMTREERDELWRRLAAMEEGVTTA